MLPVDCKQRISGLIISTHVVLDNASKEKAAQSLNGGVQTSLSLEDWIKALENGHTIQPSTFLPLPNGEFSHKKEHWKSTRFICADGDNFRGVETLTDGTEKNPDGIACWTGVKVLREKFPNLKRKVYAVGQSVSSMSAERIPQHNLSLGAPANIGLRILRSAETSYRLTIIPIGLQQNRHRRRPKTPYLPKPLPNG